MCVPRALVSKMFCACLVQPPASFGARGSSRLHQFLMVRDLTPRERQKGNSETWITNYEGRDMQFHIHANLTSMLAFTSNSSPNWLEVLGGLLSTLHLWKMGSWAKERSYCQTPAFSQLMLSRENSVMKNLLQIKLTFFDVSSYSSNHLTRKILEQQQISSIVS